MALWPFGSRARAVTFAAAAVTDRGLVRPENQDAIVSQPVRGCFAVADGIGGGEGGALASQWTAAALSDAFGRLPSLRETERQASVQSALEAANERIRAHAEAHGYRTMGSTVALFFADAGGRGWIGHVGDSRIYRIREGRMRLMTADHTVGNELSRRTDRRNPAGEARLLKSRRNPLAHVLTRAVGTEWCVRTDWQATDFAAGDRYLACTDGVHDMLDDAEISLIVKRAATPEAGIAALAGAVRRAGAADNFSAVFAMVS